MLFFKKKKEVPKKPLGLYVHIPFCVRKCQYCDFLSAPAIQKRMLSIKTQNLL